MGLPGILASDLEVVKVSVNAEFLMMSFRVLFGGFLPVGN